MKRLIHTCALAMLLGATCAHALAQTSTSGVADPQAPVPATQARPAIDYRTEPAPASTPAPATAMHGHDHHAGMEMGGMQCTAGSGDQKGMQCMKGGGTCGCCADMKMKDGGCCCDHKEAK
jgi:uncharacterized protein involved in copper resistance